MNRKTNLWVGAAVAGVLSAMAIPQSFAADQVAKGTTPEEGKCVGANSCSGKSACATASNSCAGQNACGGKGFLKTSKAKCAKMAKKNSKIHWEAATESKKDAT